MMPRELRPWARTIKWAALISGFVLALAVSYGFWYPLM